MQITNPWEKLSSNIVYKNPWITVHEDKVIMPAGDDGVYAYIESQDSVMVIALNEKHEIFLINAFRYPTSSWSRELPGGSGDGEDSLLAAKRELAEETGITAEHWEKLGETRVCSGLLTQKTAIYLAHGLSFGVQLEAADANTISDGKFYDLDSIDNMIGRGEITDCQSITAIYLTKQWLKNNPMLN